ncbi:EAL domain-containing protein [Sulfurimonas sp.]|nr:EAL domain-containing protein [Sulfurimonas sp.]
MNLNIQKFILLIVVTLLVLLFSIFSYFYFSQQEKTASIILQNLNTSMSEASYVLSKKIKSNKEIETSRPLLDRIAAGNDVVKAIFIHDTKKILISSDPYIKELLITNEIQDNNDKSKFNYLINNTYFDIDIRYYQGKEFKTFKLVYILDKEEIAHSLHKDKLFYVLYFGILPLIFLFVVWYIIRVYIIKPLELLRNFSDSNKLIPKKFFLKEIEVIRRSMLQSFIKLEEEKAELYSLSRVDVLTGLPNRKALNEYMERLIKNSRRNSKNFAFLFLDLDHFKVVNDSLGHDIGDELLKLISVNIDNMLRSSDFIARIGGDEFVLVMSDYNSLNELQVIINRIQNSLVKSFEIDSHTIHINSSIGIAIFPDDGKTLVSLMKNADIAMYESKEQGRGRYSFFTKEINSKLQKSILLDQRMKEAYKNNEYELWYQAKVDTKNAELMGVEALIRWISPTDGVIAPDTFIPQAESNGFIVTLGAWVMKTAIKQQSIWRDNGLDISVSINVSSKQLSEGNFIENSKALLERYNIQKNKIDLEITEYMILEQNDDNFSILNDLHQEGFTVSLDDFGTGYSSLSYLKKFNIDTLKIDKSFIDDYETKEGAVFIDTIVKMGQTLGMKVVAEGVESQKQVEYLKDIGCDICQGYYFSKPLRVEEFEEKYIKST